MTALSASPPLGSPEPGRRRGTVVALLVIVVAPVLVYSNTFDASFHFDDASSIVNNEGVHDLSGPSPSSARYLGELSFALDYRLRGLDVFGYHLANVLIHVCNGLLVFSLATLTLRTPVLRCADAGPLLRRHLPLVAALLFSLHPVQTQAVTYIVQRFASLATLFFVGSLVLYVKGRLALEEEGGTPVRAACFHGLSFLAAAAAMKTKEISFTLPFVAGGYELLFFRRPRWRWLLVAPLAAAALLVPLAVAPEAGSIPEALGQATRLASETGEVSTSVYLLTQTRVVVTYLRLLVLPVGQNLDYDFPISRSLAEPGVLLALAILLAVAASAVALLLRARRSNRAAGVLVFFGLAWFFVTLSVESSVIPLRDVIFEHRMYLPSVGAALALGTLVLRAVERMHLRTSLEVQCAAALLLTAGPLGVATYARNLVWRDEVTLWSDVVARSPMKARGHMNRGMAYRNSGRAEDALRELREAVRLDPDVQKARYDLGLVYETNGQLDEAMAEYRAAARLDPTFPHPHNHLGVVHHAKGQLDDAVRELREAIRLDPGFADPHTNLGVCWLLMGRVDEAILEQLEAVRLAPELAAAHNNLGSAYERAGRLDDATREYREALRLAPAFATARRNLRLVELK